MSECNHYWQVIDGRHSQCSKCGEIEKSPCREPECVDMQARIKELEGTIGLERIDAHKVKAELSPLRAESRRIREAVQAAIVSYQVDGYINVDALQQALDKQGG